MPPVIILVKFAEITFRALFIIIVTYALELEEAGQFGIIATIQGLVSFAFGFERQIDLQRRLVGKTGKIFDAEISRTLLFFFGNYLLFSPLMLVGAFLLANISGVALAFCVLIAIGEHISNLSYHLTLVNGEYRVFLFASLIKTALVFFLVLGALFFSALNLSVVLMAWGLLSFFYLIVVMRLWVNVKTPLAYKGKSVWLNLRNQYKWSKDHFFIGVLAVLAIQLDRLVAGSILAFDLVGLYFRHVLITALVYQVFNVGFYSMLVPKIFMTAKSEPSSALGPIICRTYAKVSLFLVFVSFVVVGFFLSDEEAFRRLGLNLFYLLGLLIASSARIRADLNALIFNAFYREDVVLIMQFTCLCVGAVLSFAMTYMYSLDGLIMASIFMSFAYLLLTYYFLNKLRDDLTSIRIPS